MKFEDIILFVGCGHRVSTPSPFGCSFDSKPGRCPACEVPAVRGLACFAAACEEEEGPAGDLSPAVQGLDPAHPEAQLAAKLAAAEVTDVRTGEQVSPAVLRGRYAEEVKGPGKFEGEAAYVPYLVEGMMHGDSGERECHCDTCTCDDSSCAACCAEEYGCECDSHWETFSISEEDRRIFPDLKGRESVRLYFASTGAVCED